MHTRIAFTHLTWISKMVTVSEIEAAIEKLPPAEYRELLAWIAEHQALIGASEALFAMYDDEEKSHGADASR
jgi:hypothetical protein